MKSLKDNLSSIIVCLFELCVGILLFIDPVGFASGIIRGAGVILVLVGALNILKYFTSEVLLAVQGQYLFKGLLAAFCGVFCIFRARWFVATFSILTIVYAVAILAAGLGKVQWAVDMIRMRLKEWYFSAVSAVLSIFCALIILANPFSTTKVLWQFTAVVLILEAVFDIIVLVRNPVPKTGSSTDR